MRDYEKELKHEYMLKGKGTSVEQFLFKKIAELAQRISVIEANILGSGAKKIKLVGKILDTERESEWSGNIFGKHTNYLVNSKLNVTYRGQFIGFGTASRSGRWYNIETELPIDLLPSVDIYPNLCGEIITVEKLDDKKDLVRDVSVNTIELTLTKNEDENIGPLRPLI